MLDGKAISIAVNGSNGPFLVSAGGPSDGKCIPARFDDFNVLWRRELASGPGHVEIWDDPSWKVRVEGADLFERRTWKLVSQGIVRAGVRLEGHWSHPLDDLSGAIANIQYLVNGEIDDPARGAFLIPGEEVEVDGSSFSFTIPEVQGGTLGRLSVELVKMPLATTCKNATCDAVLEGSIYIDDIRIHP